MNIFSPVIRNPLRVMKIKQPVLISLASGAVLPTYNSEGASGADIRAFLTSSKILHPGESCLIPTGIILQIPEGFEIQVRPRSGLALHHQITILNTPGTIDADYRGEIGIIMINHGKTSFLIEPNMRIAQIILAPVVQAEFVIQEKIIAATKRGDGGFGHTGIQ